MISVIIPVFNEQNDIIDCLSSLDHQRGVKFEVLIVDDGSTDNTRKLIKKYKPKSYKLKLINQDHKGAGMARNKGAKKAKGNVLVFVDADMTFDSNFLKNLTKPILIKKAKGTNSREEFVSNWDNVWARSWNYNEGWEDGKRHPANYPTEQKVFRAIKKSEFIKVNGFSNGGYTDDWSLAKKLGYEPQNAENAIFYHRNPASLNEVFHHAKWVGKREYKLGMLGAIINLIKSLPPISLISGIIKSIKYKELRFIIFKLVYDVGIALGIVSYMILKKGYK